VNPPDVLCAQLLAVVGAALPPALDRRDGDTGIATNLPCAHMRCCCRDGDTGAALYPGGIVPRSGFRGWIRVERVDIKAAA
jgi:hypothetical protein